MNKRSVKKMSINLYAVGLLLLEPSGTARIAVSGIVDKNQESAIQTFIDDLKEKGEISVYTTVIQSHATELNLGKLQEIISGN